MYYQKFQLNQVTNYSSSIKQLTSHRMSYGSNTIEYPPKKKYLHHLNLLLHNKIINPPDQLLSSKLFPARKTSNQSIAKIKQFRSQTSQNSRKREREEFRQKVFSKLKQTNDIRVSTAQLKSTPELKPQRLFKSNSVQLVRHPQTIHYNLDNIKLNKKQQKQFCQNFKQKQQQPLNQLNSIKKQFLRKGSNLNRQIVLNLLKLKLTKKYRQIQLDDNIENDDIIIKMIKIYKGGNNKSDKYTQMKAIHQMQMKQEIKYPRQITGWQEANNAQFIEYQEQDN